MRRFTFIAVLFLFSIGNAQNSDGWFIQNIATDLASVDFSSPEIVWAVGRRGVILKSTDSGITWNFQNSMETDTVGFGSGDCSFVEFLNESDGWIVKYPWILLKTSNGGLSWEQFFIDSLVYSGLIISAFFLDSQTFFINTTIGVFKTLDGGLSWDLKSNGFNILYYKIYFLNELTGWGVSPNGEILFTSDGGDNWSFQTSTVLEDLISIDFCSA